MTPAIRNIVIIAAVAVVAVATSTLAIRRMASLSPATGPLPLSENIDNQGLMRIESPAFQQGGNIPAVYTCDGADTSPPLKISGVPENARALALIVDDPDAPAGTWVHWAVWNIPPATTVIEAGKTPAGAAQGITSFGRPGYGGPCPSSGHHRYFFKVYALDLELDLDPQKTDPERLEAAMEGHIIDKAGLYGVYGR